jgi:hypothetical protein
MKMNQEDLDDLLKWFGVDVRNYIIALNDEAMISYPTNLKIENMAKDFFRKQMDKFPMLKDKIVL